MTRTVLNPTNFAPLPEAMLQGAAARSGNVLLHSAQHSGNEFRSYLFADPVEILQAHVEAEVGDVLARMDAALCAGFYVAGFASYDSGAEGDWPLLWFGVYRDAVIFDHSTGEIEHGCLPPLQTQDLQADNAAGCAAIRDLHFNICAEEYGKKIAAIHEWIRCGDTYQANFTGKLKFQFDGDATCLYRELIAKQAGSYAAFVNLGSRKILSFSPELFFKTEEREITTRPMKGTVARGCTTKSDLSNATWLQNDEKNRSENVMIVDLLRNDIGKICEFGSVRVEDLFAVERYETLFQMVSTVKGRLRSGMGLKEIFAALFPSGSITGAPKKRTMEILHELEQEKRGVYTGTIGFAAPGNRSCFSVAIRTVTLDGKRGEMGVGSGITIGSAAKDEFAECLLKGKFLTDRDEDFELIESLLWNGKEYPLLALHLDRLMDSAAYFGFAVERPIARDFLLAHRPDCDKNCKVRFTVNRIGAMQISISSLMDSKAECRVKIAQHRILSTDRFLYHKTTRRAFYNREFAAAQREGFDEVLFLNERGEVCEGAISNLFAEKNGVLSTPPIHCGLLAGVYRRKVLESAETLRPAQEKILRIDDLLQAENVYLTNAVRGMRRVTGIVLEG